MRIAWVGLKQFCESMTQEHTYAVSERLITALELAKRSSQDVRGRRGRLCPLAQKAPASKSFYDSMLSTFIAHERRLAATAMDGYASFVHGGYPLSRHAEVEDDAAVQYCSLSREAGSRIDV